MNNVNNKNVLLEQFQKRKKARLSTEGPTYMELVEYAITDLGGKATTPDITNYLENNFRDLLLKKTKTWKNSVSGCLSTQFQRMGKDELGRTIWGIKSNLFIKTKLK